MCNISIFIEDGTKEMKYRRLLLQLRNKSKVVIICKTNELNLLIEKLEATYGSNGSYTILTYNQFKESEVVNGYYIFFDIVIDIFLFHSKFKEKNNLITIIGNSSLKEMSDFKRYLDQEYNISIHGTGVTLINTSTKEILEKKRMAAELAIRNNYVGEIGIDNSNIIELVRLLIRCAAFRLILAVPWWTKVSYTYFPVLEECAKRGVNITLYYGIGENDSRLKTTDETIRMLKEDFAGYVNVKFKRFQGHCAVVISDDFYMNSSQNFTSLVANPWLELGDLVSDASEAKISSLINKIERWTKKENRTQENF